MKRIWSWIWKLALGGVILIVAVIVSAMIYFRTANPWDVIPYAGMNFSYHPVWREFAFRRVREGDSAEALLKQFPPHWQHPSGRYVRYDYFQTPPGKKELPFVGFTVIAKDGKVAAAAAWSCTWQRVFFDLNAADQAEMDAMAKQEYEALEP